MCELAFSDPRPRTDKNRMPRAPQRSIRKPLAYRRSQTCSCSLPNAAQVTPSCFQLNYNTFCVCMYVCIHIYIYIYIYIYTIYVYIHIICLCATAVYSRACCSRICPWAAPDRGARWPVSTIAEATCPFWNTGSYYPPTGVSRKGTFTPRGKSDGVKCRICICIYLCMCIYLFM